MTSIAKCAILNLELREGKEGVIGSLSNSNLFVNGGKMQFVNMFGFGFFVALSIALGVVLVVVLKRPRAIQNIIHLGLKNGQMTTELLPASLSIRPEDFQINAEKLRGKLLHCLDTCNHPCVQTRAYTILKYSGVESIVDSSSRQEAQKALTRLLINEDDDATKRFLETLADSVCVSTGSLTTK